MVVLALGSGAEMGPVDGMSSGDGEWEVSLW